MLFLVIRFLNSFHEHEETNKTQSLSTTERYASKEYILYVAIFFRIKNILLEDTKN